MFAPLRNWFQRAFSDPQVVILALLLVAGLVIVVFLGRFLAPVLASIVIAYLLEGGVARLQRFAVPRLISVILAFSAFMAVLVLLLFGVTPMIARQMGQAVAAVPGYVRQIQELLAQLPEQYPQLVSQEQITRVLANVEGAVVEAGGKVLSISGFMVIAALVIFLVLIPILVFFLLKDKDLILAWFRRYLPSNRGLAIQVWREVDAQMGNYVRGKVLEILIVWIVTYAVFALFGLQFAMLLSMLVGFSVIIPYVGAAVVTIPVALVALVQFGFSAEFAWILIAYAIIQALDGNVLVPILFSEVVNLHPVAIIVAVLVFGGIWGFWGVFFAIPLATLVNAVLRAWPRVHEESAGQESEASA